MPSPSNNTGNGLGSTAAHGAAWLTIGQLTGRGLGAFKILVLAALLPQNELGLFGAAIVVVELIEQLSQTGMKQALIQTPENVDGKLLGTAWTSQILRGAVIAATLFLVAGQVESFLDKPGLKQLIQAIALYPLLQSFRNAGLVHLHREMKFQKVVGIELISVAVDLSSSIALTLVQPLAMSLVTAKLLGSAAGLIASFILERRMALIHFSFDDFRRLYRFGFWVFVSAILSFVMIRGGDIIIAKQLTSADLAIYQVSYSLVSVPIISIMGVIRRSMFPAFSQIQGDSPRLAAVFLKVFSLVNYIATFSVVGAACIGGEFVDTFLSAEYIAAKPLIPLLAVWTSCRGLGAMNTVLFQAIGKPAFATSFQFLMVALFALILIPAGALHGLIGIAIGLMSIGIVAQLGRYIALVYMIEVTFAQVSNRVLIPVLAGAISVVVTLLVASVLPTDSSLIKLIIKLILIVGIYGISITFVDAKMHFGVLDFLRSRFRFPKLQNSVR